MTPNTNKISMAFVSNKHLRTKPDPKLDTMAVAIDDFDRTGA